MVGILVEVKLLTLQYPDSPRLPFLLFFVISKKKKKKKKTFNVGIGDTIIGRNHGKDSAPRTSLEP
jgi:hypothetical protein